MERAHHTPTTSIKLPPDLKARVAAAAASAGKSAHAFMIEAIEQTTRAAEQRAQFVAGAIEARAEVDRDGIVYAAQDVRTLLGALARGEKADLPAPAPWPG